MTGQEDIEATCALVAERIEQLDEDSGERESIFGNFSARADGERRGLARVGRVASKRSR